MATFTQRTTAPSTTDKNWLHTSNSGYNYCIEINNSGSCIPNCVGYAWGRWREILGAYHNLSRGDAENWYGNTSDGYARGQTPKVGAVICWSKGVVGNNSDGAGHVGIVEAVSSDGTTITTSESAYGGTRWYSKTRTSGYAISGYAFQGFIYLPSSVTINSTTTSSSSTSTTTASTTSTTPPTTHTVKSGDTLSAIAKTYYGSSSKTYYDYIADANGISKTTYAISVGKVLTIPVYAAAASSTTTATTTTTLAIGDKVEIIGTGNGNSSGTGSTARGIGWSRQVLDIKTGKTYPYQIGNNSGTTGYYKASALKKK